MLTHTHIHEFCRQVKVVFLSLEAPPGLYTQVLRQKREFRKDRAGEM